MKRLLRVALMVVAMLVASTLLAPSAANATWNDPQVNLSGHMDCGGASEPTWVWYEATNGERGWANTEDWTSVSRLIGGWLGLVKVRTYKITLWDVPTSGTTITIKMGCRGLISGTTTEYQTSFGVNRPTFGRGATRHICVNPPLGCWV